MPGDTAGSPACGQWVQETRGWLVTQRVLGAAVKRWFSDVWGSVPLPLSLLEKVWLSPPGFLAEDFSILHVASVGSHARKSHPGRCQHRQLTILKVHLEILAWVCWRSPSLSRPFFLSFLPPPSHVHREATVFLEKWRLQEEKWHPSQATLGLPSVSPKTQRFGDTVSSSFCSVAVAHPQSYKFNRTFLLLPPFCPPGGQILDEWNLTPLPTPDCCPKLPSTGG